MGNVLQWLRNPGDQNLEEDLETWIREQNFPEPDISVEEELAYFGLLDYTSDVNPETQEFHQELIQNPSEPEEEPEDFPGVVGWIGDVPIIDNSDLNPQEEFDFVQTLTLDHQTVRENILRRARIAQDYRVIQNWTHFTSSLLESRRAARVIHTWLQFRHS